MKKINKKGFTIVELVIVIAVIAILAAVLIPTFSSLVKTAQTSSDVSLVKNLNISLNTSEILDGKNVTFTDALNDVKEDGFDVTKLTPTNSDNDILWDENTNRFVLHVDGVYKACGSEVEVDEEKLYKLWKIYNEIPALEDQTYSIYYIGEEVANAEVKVGFDSNVKVDNLVYTSDKEQTVIIRTNSANTTLTINAEHDTVNHYGSVGRVDVQKIDMNCYNEYGKAAYIKVTEGKVVAKAGGKINVLFANNATSSNVVAVTDGGLIEQGYTLAGDAGSSNIELTPSTIEAVEKIAVDVIETAVEKETVEADESDFWIVCHADAFAAGSGTKQDPYIIKTARQLSLLAYNVNTLQAGYASAYYRLEKDIDLSGKAWIPIGTTNEDTTAFFTGHFDGNGHSIIGLTNNDKTDVDLGLYREELSSVRGLAASYGLFGFAKDAEFIDIDIKSAKIEGSSHFIESGFIVGKAVGKISMTDCSVDENSVFNGKSKVGGMIGFIANGSTAVMVTFSNCSFAGSITVQNRAGAMIGAMTVNAKDIYVFDGCTSTGSLTATNADGYGLGLVGYKYQGDADQERLCYSTFSFTDCSVDLTKFNASAGVGKYIGRVNKSFIMIVDSEYDTNALGQFQDNGQDGVFVFNGQMYVERTGSAGTNMLELTLLSEETYDLGQYRYKGYSSNYPDLTSYGTNLLSKSDSFFASINQSSYAVENYRIKFATGDAKFALDLEQFSEYVASGYTATVTHTDGSMYGFTITAISE